MFLSDGAELYINTRVIKNHYTQRVCAAMQEKMRVPHGAQKLPGVVVVLPVYAFHALFGEQFERTLFSIGDVLHLLPK